MQCKKGLYLSFDFGWYTIHLDIAREEQWVGVTKGGRGGVINRQNLLSVMKVIFRQSLKLVGLSCYLKNKEKKSSCSFLEGLISFLNWLIFSESFYFSFYVLLAISTRLNKNHLYFRI